MSDLAALKADIARPRLELRLCLRADLFAREEALRNELARVVLQDGATLAGSPQAQEIRAQLDELTVQMEAATHTFTFQAVPRSEYATLEDANKPTSDGQYPPKFLEALVAASLLTPDLSTDDVAELFADLSAGQVDELETAALKVNRAAGVVDIPFSESG
jgi:hypothetical protein